MRSIPWEFIDFDIFTVITALVIAVIFDFFAAQSLPGLSSVPCFVPLVLGDFGKPGSAVVIEKPVSSLSAFETWLVPVVRLFTGDSSLPFQFERNFLGVFGDPGGLGNTLEGTPSPRENRLSGVVCPLFSSSAGRSLCGR